MPRRSYLRCPNCQEPYRKSDTDCAACGKMTPTEQWRWITRGLGLLVAVGAWLWIDHVVKGLVH